MEAADIVRFARRDWDRLSQQKAEYWASLKTQKGHAEGFLIADELRQHAQRLHPDWPSERDRQEDLESHIRVAAALRSVHAVRRP